MTIQIATASETREILGGGNTWPEATILSDPQRKAKPGMEPKLLVKRNITELAGPKDERLFCLPGQPAISLFSGCGGMDLGVEMAGCCCLVQHELDRPACETLLKNRPNFFRHAALIQGDICLTPTSMILEAAGMRVGEAHIVCGGPPCQGFSTAGRRDPDDPRNSLVFEFLRVVREAQPAFFIMENVPGIVSMKKGELLEQFLKVAHESYYEPVYGMVNAVEHGVPQDRVRMIVIGTRRDLCEIERAGRPAPLPLPTTFHQDDLDLLEYADKRPLLALNDLRDEIEDIRTTYGLWYSPDRPYIRPMRPTVTRDGRIVRSSGYMKLFRKLRKQSPEIVVLDDREDLGGIK